MPLVFAAAVLAAFAWLYLLCWHGGFWRTDQRLPDPARVAAGQRWPAVVAVVPARDEAEVLRDTLPTLLCQEYPGQLDVILVDDESADGTAAVAAELGRQAVRHGSPGRLIVLPGSPTPEGWAGKVWAMAQGLSAARAADYVLFTDADIGYAPGTVTALVSAAEAGGLALVSQMALLRAQTRWERLLIPAFVYFFAKLYPFRLVNRRGSRTAAAAGGCMLVRRRALADAGGLRRVGGARIDDVALGTLLKRSGHDCWLGFSTAVVSRRGYDRLKEIWDMVARSAYTQLRYSPIALAATVAGLAWLYLLPVAATLAGAWLAARGHERGAAAVMAAGLAAAGIAAWAIMSASYLPVLRLYRLSPLRALSLPLVAGLYAAMTVSSAWRHHAGRGGQWKGRTIGHAQIAADAAAGPAGLD